MLQNIFRVCAFATLGLIVTSCATSDKILKTELISQERKLDATNPEKLEVSMQLAMRDNNSVEITLNQRAFVPQILTKTTEVTKDVVMRKPQNPIFWLLLASWNPILWIDNGLLAYKMLLGQTEVRSETVTDSVKAGSEWIEGLRKESTAVYFYSDPVCKSGCPTMVNDGKGIFSFTEALVNSDIQSPQQLPNIGSVSFTVTAKIPSPGSDVTKSISANLATINFKEVNDIISNKKIAAAQAQEAERQALVTKIEKAKRQRELYAANKPYRECKHKCTLENIDRAKKCRNTRPEQIAEKNPEIGKKYKAYDYAEAAAVRLANNYSANTHMKECSSITESSSEECQSECGYLEATE